MERRMFVETLGLLTKLEKLVSVNQHIQPNTLLLENTQPYPGYYSQHEVDLEKPRTVFIVTKERYSIDEVLRLMYEARKIFNHQLDATPCKISIFSDSYYAIRVRHLKNFGMVKDFQDFLRGEGVVFLKHRAINDTATLEIQKLFNLEEIIAGVYQDLDESGERYISLSVKLDFGQFVKVTQAVKNNIDENNFDAALAVFYRKNGVVDAVRVFEPFISIHNLEKIRMAYEDQIRRLKLNEI
ncbi:hypothetical protein [Alistipes sp. ZOR0009]|uniref:hypothetical protein n=1 Tax=Alistipes sp. ZOR0009 TaxID=1339253 RepID=UPI000647D739|nr:hypothetical protein [Alistipes sp. ZOR0009]